jgi:hypothetical protein
MGFGAVEFLAMGTGVLLMLLLCTFFVLLASAMTWFELAIASTWLARLFGRISVGRRSIC